MGCGALGLAGWLVPAAARADFSETPCSNGPAAPWTNGVDGAPGFALGLDECTSGGGYQFVIGGNNTIPPGDSTSAGIEMPAGEVLTGVNANYTTVASTSTGALMLVADSDGYLVDAAMGSGQANGVLSAALPDSSELTFRVYCTEPTSSAPSCAFPSNPLIVGAITLDIHDTGAPTVAAAGGSLAAKGTYSGLQTLGYAAQDAGSGVAKVTATLGATVVGSASSPCQPFELSPCPHTATGTFTIDTAAIANGAYPLTLTAQDASGDPATVAVDTVTIRNSGTVSVTPRRSRRDQVSATVVTAGTGGTGRTRECARCASPGCAARDGEAHLRRAGMPRSAPVLRAAHPAPGAPPPGSALPCRGPAHLHDPRPTSRRRADRHRHPRWAAPHGPGAAVISRSR